MYRVITKDGIVYEMGGQCNHVYTGDQNYVKCSTKRVDDHGETHYDTLCYFAHDMVAMIEFIG